MDKLSKQILKYLCAQADAGSAKYDYDKDLETIAEKVGSDKEAVRACIRYLEADAYLIYIKNQNGRNLFFSLDHRGLHWKEFRWEEIRRYLEEKWIDFFALVVAALALAVSILNLFTIAKQ